MKFWKASSGFSLVEMVVATSVFVLLFGVTVGVYFFQVRQQQRGALTGTTLGEMQNFLEVLEREVRTGFGSTFTPPGSACSNTFTFQNQNRQLVTYGVNKNLRLERGVGAVSQVITPESVEVRDLCFRITAPSVGAGSPAVLTGRQGRVTISMRVCPKGVSDARCARLQTTLTSRQHAPP